MEQEMRSIKEGLERIYSAEYLFKIRDPPVKCILDALHMQPDDKIVELGAGIGHFTLPIAEYLDKSDGSGVVFACDFSKSLVDALKRRVTERGMDIRVRSVCLADMKPDTLPLADDRVDTVLAVNSIQYLADPVPYLREIARVLSPGGSILIADWRRDSTEVSSAPVPEGLSQEDLYPLLEEAGLDAYVPFHLDGYSWTMRAMKPIVDFS